MTLCLGAKTFLSNPIPVGACNSHGLPVTPSSVKLLGRFPNLTLFRHKNLCQYLDLVRGTRDRLVIVSEYYTKCLADIEPSKLKNQLPQLIGSILCGLEYLSKKNITHRNLSPKNILINPENIPKLCDYGLFYLSNHNKNVPFPIGFPLYTSAEHFIFKEKTKNPLYSNPIGDIWSFGMVMFDWLTKFSILQNERNDVTAIISLISDIIKSKENVVEFLINKLPDKSYISWWPKELYSLLNECLRVDPRKRKSASELLCHTFFSTCTFSSCNKKEPNFKLWNFVSIKENIDETLFIHDKKNIKLNYTNILMDKDLEEIYYLIKISEGDIFSRLKTEHLMKYRPTIFSLPKIITMNGNVFGYVRDEACFYNDYYLIINLNELIQKIATQETCIHFPLILDSEKPDSINKNSIHPIQIKERDMIYQLYRMNLFRGLLNAYPYTRDQIVAEAKIDIPPLFRGKIWAAILNVKGDYRKIYSKIDKKSPSVSDKQIDVDLPRCHQYEQLMTSSHTKAKLKRIVKAWLYHNSSLVYWQGLDSLAVPFLLKNMTDEALAFASFNQFVDKFCHNFFLKENCSVMNEYLAIFSQLLVFHDPELARHLSDINFKAELYAIPWFLTMFSHVLSLHTLCHLWDTLILGSSYFPMCFGVGILMSTRSNLVGNDFNQCILNFSNFSEIDINQCLTNAISVYNRTPPSIAEQNYDKSILLLRYPCEEERRFWNLPGRNQLKLNELQQEICPRISCQDAFRIVETQEICGGNKFMIKKCHSPNININTSSELSSNTEIKNIKKSIVFIDLRPTYEYLASHIKNSINIPIIDFSKIDIKHFQKIRKYEGSIIVLSANKVKDASLVGSCLVKNRFQYVCTLDIDIPSLSEHNLLIK